MDALRVDVPGDREHPRRALGLRGARMGRLLGMGPGRECRVPAAPDRERGRPLRDDSREARAAQGLECLPRLSHLFPDDLRNVLDPVWRHRERALVRAILDWELLRLVFGPALRGLRDVDLLS